MKPRAAIRSAVVALGLIASLPAYAAEATRRDDAYHFALYASGEHAANYVEWWYFNLFDASSRLQLAVTYAILDPANISGFGTASLAVVAYTPDGAFTETNVAPPAAFGASPDQADVLIAGTSRPALNFIQVLSDDVYRVTGAVDGAHHVSWNLLYLRQSRSWLAFNRTRVGVLPWEEMGWVQYMPGASVWGDVEIDGRHFRVSNVRGYHDHNWGTWIPFTVTWNWTQYFEPGLAFSIGDFRNSAAGLVSIDVAGTRTVFSKDQYFLLHEDWRLDLTYHLWFPGKTTLYASNGREALVVVMRADDTVPVTPPREIPLPLIPVIYEQTADFSGSFWESDGAGTWRLVRAFRGGGFKEYTDVTVPPPF